MPDKKVVVVFDFCETIVSIQTADRFVDFVGKSKNKLRNRLINLILIFFSKTRFIPLCNFFFPKLNISKRLKLLQLRGLNKNLIIDLASKYYQNVICQNFNPIILDKLKYHQEQEQFIVVSSGGYNLYLEIFAKEYKVDELFCTNIEFKNGIATGLINGEDCMFDNKVKLLNNYFNSYSNEIIERIVYTDNISDLPLLRWATKPFVISYNKSQDWAKQNQFSEIIIER